MASKKRKTSNAERPTSNVELEEGDKCVCANHQGIAAAAGSDYTFGDARLEFLPGGGALSREGPWRVGFPGGAFAGKGALGKSRKWRHHRSVLEWFPGVTREQPLAVLESSERA